MYSKTVNDRYNIYNSLEQYNKEEIYFVSNYLMLNS